MHTAACRVQCCVRLVSGPGFPTSYSYPSNLAVDRNESPNFLLRCDLTQVEFPVALIDRNLDKKPPEARAAAEAFLQYCFTPAAQREFAACGFRCALLAGIYACTEVSGST